MVSKVKSLSCIQLLDSSLTSLLHLWDFPGKNTGVGCHCLLQEIFLTQGLNLSFLHCRRILYCLSHQGSSHAATKIQLSQIKILIKASVS